MPIRFDDKDGIRYPMPNPLDAKAYKNYEYLTTNNWLGMSDL